MRRRRTLEVLQWFGLLGAALAWASQHVLGYGITEAVCGTADLGVRNDPWQIALTATAASIVVAAEAAAVLVYLGTRPSSYEDAPPSGRMQLFSIAAMVANVLFLAIILLDGIATLYGYGCRQS
jgi:hypothetical protein